MIQAQVDKQIAMATIEIERQHSHYGALLQRVKIVASHPLSKTGMGHAVGPERKFHGNPLVDGKLSSLPMVSEDSVITQIWPETLEQKIQPLKNRSLRFSSQETTAKSAATTNRGGIALEQEFCSQVLKHALWSWETLLSMFPLWGEKSFQRIERRRVLSHNPKKLCWLIVVDIALDGDGVRGARVFSQQLMRTLDRAVAKKSEVLDLSNMSLSWLPESIGLVMNLTSLDLSGTLQTSWKLCCGTQD